MAKKPHSRLLSTLLIILAIDAFRTLFESAYFGAWYTSLVGFLPKTVHAYLTRPEIVFIPKFINFIAAIIVICILLYRWIQQEERENSEQKNLVDKQTRKRLLSWIWPKPLRWFLIIADRKRFEVEMRIIAYFEDKPGMMEHRAENAKAHLAYLKTNQSEIPIAGGLRPELNGVFVGGLWVMEVESFERAEELVKNDPYYKPDLRSYKLLVWGKAFDEKVVL